MRAEKLLAGKVAGGTRSRKVKLKRRSYEYYEEDSSDSPSSSHSDEEESDSPVKLPDAKRRRVRKQAKPARSPRTLEEVRRHFYLSHFQ